jgi:hypothetical protein
MSSSTGDSLGTGGGPPRGHVRRGHRQRPTSAEGGLGDRGKKQPKPARGVGLPGALVVLVRRNALTLPHSRLRSSGGPPMAEDAGAASVRFPTGGFRPAVERPVH